MCQSSSFFQLRWILSLTNVEMKERAKQNRIRYVSFDIRMEIRSPRGAHAVIWEAKPNDSKHQAVNGNIHGSSSLSTNIIGMYIYVSLKSNSIWNWVLFEYDIPIGMCKRKVDAEDEKAHLSSRKMYTIRYTNRISDGYRRTYAEETRAAQPISTVFFFFIWIN